MFISDPDFLPIPDPGSRIRDQKTSTKERGEKFFCHTFFLATNFTKFKIILFLKCLRKKFGQFQFAPKNMGLGSGINLFRIPFQGSKRHRIPDPDPQDWH
jgi:hypothetical protein